jgi:tetratricopeptide (TPR) repeat protein
MTKPRNFGNIGTHDVIKRTLFLILILIFCFCDVFVRADYGLDRFPRLKTIFDCPIRLSPLAKPYAIIPANTIVVKQGRNSNVNDIPYVLVSVPSITDFGNQLTGWMKEDDLRELALKVENDFKTEQKSDREKQEGFDKYQIRLSMANELCQENEMFDKDKRSPEPYFTRAPIYRQAGEHALAMMDYFEGLSYVQNQFPSGYQYVPYEKYFNEIKESVEKALYQPCLVVRLGRNEIDTAGRYFSQGYTHFWDGKCEKALCNFDNAINIVGKVPIYWYYRGLTYWSLGNKQKATYNFLMASIMEKNIVENEIAKAEQQAEQRGNKVQWANKYPLQSEVSEYLSRFQGNDRMFLEKIRWGDPSNLILKTFLDETDKEK